MAEIIPQLITITGMGVAVGGGMSFIVIIFDYVLTSIFSMMKGR